MVHCHSFDQRDRSAGAKLTPMWSNVLSNLQNDLSEFAKELSAGVPTSGEKDKGTTTEGEAKTTSDEVTVGTETDAGEENARAAPTASKNSRESADDGTVEAAVSAKEQIDKTFQLEWASSSDEDGSDTDDIASEWEQVTKMTRSPSKTNTTGVGAKEDTTLSTSNRDVVLPAPASKTKSELQSELSEVRSAWRRDQEELREAKAEIVLLKAKAKQHEAESVRDQSELAALREEIKVLKLQLQAQGEAQ